MMLVPRHESAVGGRELRQAAKTKKIERMARAVKACLGYVSDPFLHLSSYVVNHVPYHRVLVLSLPILRDGLCRCPQ
eukprot:752118-Hanusia_phi.AAC.5